MFASSDKEDNIDLELSSQSIHENGGEETAEEDTHSMEDFSPTYSQDLEFSPESSDTDVLSHRSDLQEGSYVDSDVSDDVAPISRGQSRGQSRGHGKGRGPGVIHILVVGVYPLADLEDSLAEVHIDQHLSLR